ncbi:MAG: tRNA pseudouridine(55) synthase TruB [Desulfobacterales bacterium]|nr:tRNA pseudouridine(55) synthase TruB [Desulfobacterales bacterium]
MRTDTNGVVIVDKPAGISSARVVAEVKRICNARKTGHAGTLDPFATGTLVCCLNQATRLAKFFLHDRKKYRGTLHLGIDTDTQDLTGRVLSENKTLTVTAADIRQVFDCYTGTIEQAPPVYSALKHKGTPLYRLARKGQPVQKPPRKVTIAQLTILEIAIPFVSFEVTCSAGTYIRTLCADIGRQLGCGGHLKALQRLESSGFSIAEAVTLDDLEELVSADALASRLISMADALRGMPAVRVDRQLADRIGHGQRINRSDLADCLRLESLLDFKVLGEDGKLLAVMSSPQEGQRLNYSCVFNH